MDLDDLSKFHSLDTQNMIVQINNLPQQLENAWELGTSLRLPEMAGLKNILIAGMGGAAIGADLLAAYAAPLCPLPIIIHRDYDLPAWARGPETLVIALSHSYETEETLAAFEQARAQGCRVLVISTRGKLTQTGQANGLPVWQFAHTGQPRSAVGYFFGLLLAALYQLGLVPDPDRDLHDTMHALRNQQTNLLAEVPQAFNPAKRMIDLLVGRWVTVFAADYLDPVARRWKCQFNEIAKTWAQFEFIPEADHNTLAGLNNSRGALMQTIALFLNAPANHPRNLLRLDFSREIFSNQGIQTHVIQAKGQTRLAHIWTLLHLGDYTSYYLAMAYGEDPTPVDVLTGIKTEMSKAG